MKKLSRQQLQEKEQHVQKIREAKEALEREIGKFNTELGVLRNPVEQALANLNDAVTAANEFRQGIADDQENYYDERSEKWQEGDNGSAYSEWKDSWGNEFSEVEMEFPDELEEPDCDAADDLETMPDEPNTGF